MTRRRTVSNINQFGESSYSLSSSLEQIRVLREQLQRLEELVAELQEELESSKAVALSLSNVQMQSQRQAEASNFGESNPPTKHSSLSK